MERKVRKNGLSSPLHPLQLTTWLFTCLNLAFISLITFSVLNSWIFQWKIQIIFAICYYSTQIAVIFLGFMTTISDPTDPIPLAYRSSVSNNSYFDEKICNSYCSICTSLVDDSSKHCGTCDRCVNEFDHHCVWLNNCIGKQNYKIFLGLIISLELNMIFIFAYGLSLIDLKINHLDTYNQIIDHKFDVGKADFALIIGFVLVIESVITFIFDAWLITLHIWLKFKKITTYQWIMQKKKNSKLNKIHAKDFDVTILANIDCSFTTNENQNNKFIRSAELDKTIFESVRLDSNLFKNPGFTL